MQKFVGVGLCTALIILTVLSSGKDVRAQGFTGTLKLGLTASSLSGESSVEFKNKFGWGGGLGIGYDFNNGFILQLEGLYIVKGGDAETDGANFSRIIGDEPQPGSESIQVNMEWSLTYLEFPLLLIYRFETPSAISPRIFAGPSLSSNMDARLCYQGGSLNVEFCDTDDSVLKTDYGFVVGAGLDMSAGSERLSIGARMTLGRSNIRSNDPPIRNRSFNLFAGLVF